MKKNHMVTLRVTRDEKERIEKKAEIEKKNVSQFIRDKILYYIVFKD